MGLQSYSLPVSTDAGIVGHLIVVDSPLTLLHEPVLLTVGPDAGCSQEGLLEVRVDGRASDRLQTLQLTRGGHIETLNNKDINFKQTLQICILPEQRGRICPME